MVSVRVHPSLPIHSSADAPLTDGVSSQPASSPLPPSHTHIQDYHQVCHSKLCVLMSPGWQWEAVGVTDRYCTLHINADIHSSHHYFRLFQ